VPSRYRSWRFPLGIAAAAAAVMVAGGAMLLGGRDGAGPGPGAGAAAAVTPAPQAPPPAPAPLAGPAPAAQPDAAITDARPEAAVAKEPDPADVKPAAVAAALAKAPATPPAERAPVRIVNIPPGGTILAAARALYGKLPENDDTRALLSEIRRLNPDLRDVNVVKAGATVKFPQPTTQTENDEQPSE
jgi:hypothetical protein